MIKTAWILLLCAPCLALSDIINIAFHNGNTTLNAMTTRPDGAVVKTSTDTWNNFANNGGVGLAFTGLSLLDDSGAATGATIDASAGFSAFNNNNWGGRTQDSVMMEGWYGILNTEVITINNLPAVFSAGFTVEVYGDLDAPGRIMNYRIGGQTQTLTGQATNFNNDFTNYQVTFSGLSGTGFTLSGNQGATEPGRSAVNGIRIISVIPEPASGLLFLFGIALLRLRLRTRVRLSTTGA